MTTLYSTASNVNKTIRFPDNDGILALTSDITNVANRLMGFYPIIFSNNGSTLRLKVKIPFAQYTRLWFMFIGTPGGKPSIQFIHAHTENNIPQANVYNILKTDDNYVYTVDSATLDSNNYMDILFKRPSNSYDMMQVVTINTWCNFGHTFS